MSRGAIDYPLVAIVGPTAAGKSALALAVAERFAGEIINCDSVQVYRGFDIGSGKLPAEERRGLPHHLLDILEPGEVFTAGDYRRAALNALQGIRQRGKLPVLVGGTGLYLRALLLGLFEGPPRSDALRARLREMAARRGRGFLHRLLARLDPDRAGQIKRQDTQKIIRAIEVCLLARQPMSRLLEGGRRGLSGFRVYKIGLDPPRRLLYQRIDRRVEQMFAAGLLEETRAMLARPDAARLKPLEAVGYRQACEALRGALSVADAIRAAQTATRHYAKRQLTWFHREKDVTWFAGMGDAPEVQQQVLFWLERRLQPDFGVAKSG
jgi:tRNA dimethylallyltransferase